MKPKAFLSKGIKQYMYLTLDLGGGQKLKVQPSPKKNIIQISFVFTHLKKHQRRALKTLEKVANFLDTPQTEVSLELFLNEM